MLFSIEWYEGTVTFGKVERIENEAKRGLFQEIMQTFDWENHEKPLCPVRDLNWAPPGSE
jgi:hypothetical protein